MDLPTRDGTHTKLVGDCISDTTWKEIWDAMEKRMLATDDLRAQQEELVMDVEQECPRLLPQRTRLRRLVQLILDAQKQASG